MPSSLPQRTFVFQSLESRTLFAAPSTAEPEIDWQTSSPPVMAADAEPKMSVTLFTSDDQAAETGDKAYFTILRGVPLPGHPDPGLTVNYTISGSATPSSDYVALPGSVFIPPAVGSIEVAVEPLDDLEKESAETVIMTLQAGSDYELDPGYETSTVYIQDKESTVTISALDAAAAESGTPATNKGQFRVSRSGAGNLLPLTVAYTLTGTAESGTDYEALSGTVTIPAGSSSATFDVKPLDDTTAEPVETVIATLTEGSSYYLGTTKTATVNIADNEPVVTISATDAASAESGTPATNKGQFRVSRSGGGTTQPLTVAYTMSGTAQSGTDYEALSGSVTIPVGATNATFDVKPLDDSEAEPLETVIATLSSGTSYNLGATTVATVNITDNEPVVTITASDATASETGPQTGQFRINRTGPTTQSLAVVYSMDGHTADTDDYSLSTGGYHGTVTIPAGQSYALVTLTPTFDSDYSEGAEVARMYIGPDSASPPKYTLGGSTNAAITIQDAVFVNTPPTIAASGGSASANEGSSANKTGTFSDIDPGDSVTITKVSGPGTITQTGTSSGTWTWSYSGSDGPESGTVTVNAADIHGGSTTTSFSYTITNVSPVVSASSTEPIIDAGVSYLEVGTAFTGGGTFTYPGADTWTGTVNWGDGGDAQSLALSGKNFTLNHTYANPGTFTTTVTITDDDGGVGTQTLTVTVVQVSEMVVSDAVISSNTLSINTSTSVDFYIAEITSGADAGTAKLMLDALGTPQTSQAGAHVLWSVSGSAASPNSGNFGAADPVVTLTPTGGNRDFVATIGFDTNGDGTLQQTEIDRTANVHVLRLDWTLISTNSDGSAVVDAMEEDPLEYNGNVLGYPENGAVNFTLYTTNPDGTVAEIDNLNANNSNFMLPSGLVLDGDTDHKFKYTTYAEATIGNAVVRSNEIDTDIYELWINYFRDDATGKDWKVTVGDAIAYDAFAASKCTDWFWDMPDGFEDAWSPARGDAKSGNQMVIPFSDLSDAENDWFGDAYGTVYVKCVSGLGVTHEFYSTDMPTPQKAKVFFDPSKTLDGNNAAAVGGIPAWFTFWNQTAAGSNNVSFDSTLGAGTYGVTRWYRDTTTGEVTDVDQPLIGGSANGSSSVGLTTTTITGIDTFYMTVRHEMLHYDELTASIGEPNVDGDGLAASLEGDKNGNGVIDGGETDPALFSTHGITPSGPSDVEWRAYWMESNAWNSSIGTFDSVDWSKGGKQW